MNLSAKEKAKELYNNFHSVIPSFADEGLLEHNTAKQCALLEVRGIIEALEKYDESTEAHLRNEFGIDYSSYELQNMDSDLRYYYEVEKEIEKL